MWVSFLFDSDIPDLVTNSCTSEFTEALGTVSEDALVDY